jgi:hypothetical protein
MDAGLLTACFLGATLVAGVVFLFGRRFIPKEGAPFASLSKEMREALLRRKLRLRGLALALFFLAALTMFSALPRGIALAFCVSGFFCQYKVFCLRRRYPMRPNTSASRRNALPPATPE